MARLSDIAAASTGLAPTDRLVGVTAANVDFLYTEQQLTVAPPNSRTANYTLVLNDGNGVVEMNVAGANTLTIPTNASVAFPIGTSILVLQYGSGQTTIAAPGVTLRQPFGLSILGQYRSATLYQRAVNEWYVWVS